MRRDAKVYLLAACCTASALSAYSQSIQNTHKANPAFSSEQGPVGEQATHRLAFTAGEPIAGFKPSPVVILPTQCTSDGALFLDMLNPPSFMQQAIYAVGPKTVQGFEVSAMSDLHGVQIISFFPGDEQISVMVRATKEANPASGEAKVRQSSYGFFVARFKRSGEYLKSVQLNLHDALPSHIAALASGEYLVTAYDRANDMPRLYLVDGDGQVLRSLVLPYNIGQYAPTNDPNSGKGMIEHSRVLGSILLTAHRDQVLVWRRGGAGPILSVGDHGSSREVQLDVPKGLTLADVLPSDKLWVAHFQVAQHPQDQAQDNHQMPYYQFDPSDGSLTSKLTITGDTPEHTPAVIACEEGGTFVSYQTDEKGQTRILSAQ